MFGFVGDSLDERSDKTSLRQQVIAQMTRRFLAWAKDPKHMYLEDWNIDPFTTTAADKTWLFAHATYDLPPTLQPLWQTKLHFAVPEVAPSFVGVLEGANQACHMTPRQRLHHIAARSGLLKRGRKVTKR